MTNFDPTIGDWQQPQQQPGQAYPGQPGQHPGQPVQYPGQPAPQYPNPAQYPGQSGQPYGAPQSGQPYGAPQSGQPYGAPQSGQPYGAPQSGQPYGAPQSGQPYGAPQSGQPFPGQPQYAGAAYGFPGQTPPKKKRTGLIVGVIVLVVALVGGGIAYAATRNGSGGVAGLGGGTDSGVTACKQFADQSGAGAAGAAGAGAAGAVGAGDTLTEDQYHQARSQFSGSHYSDLQSSGTKFIDVVWKLQTDETSDPNAALTDLGTVFADYALVSAACANHGVTLPSLGGLDGLGE